MTIALLDRTKASHATLTVAAGFLAVVAFTSGTHAQQNQQQTQGRGLPQNAVSSDLRISPVQGNVYMLAGAGGNIAVQIGDEGVLLVDTGLAEHSGKVVEALRKLTNKPIRHIINTHVHEDHTGGNDSFTKLGVPIIAHENVLNRMTAPSGQPSPRPIGAWPTDTFFTEKKELYFNGESIQIIHQPAAHTDGDVFVYFRRSDVVAAGDIFVMTEFPIIDAERGGTTNGIVNALNRLIDITIPRGNQEAGTYVIPGHGRVCDEADVVEFRDMMTIIRDRFQDMVKKGLTLAQVKAAMPVLDYEGRWGATTGPWTTDAFIEAVYNDLSKKKS